MATFALLLVLPVFIIADPLANVKDNLYKLALDDLFTALDKDGDGLIRQDDFVRNILSFDENNDNNISLEEFAANIDKVDVGIKESTNSLFRIFDPNNNGQVAKSDIEAVFKLTDSNGDDQIDKSEFELIFDTVVTTSG